MRHSEGHVLSPAGEESCVERQRAVVIRERSHSTPSLCSVAGLGGPTFGMTHDYAGAGRSPRINSSLSTEALAPGNSGDGVLGIAIHEGNSSCPVARYAYAARR